MHMKELEILERTTSMLVDEITLQGLIKDGLNQTYKLQQWDEERYKSMTVRPDDFFVSGITRVPHDKHETLAQGVLSSKKYAPDPCHGVLDEPLTHLEV